MVSVLSLWLPVLLSAVFVFAASSIIHMVLSYHAGEVGPVPDEGKVMNALRPFKIPPGDYVMPHASSTKEMGEPEFIDKTTRGPVAYVTMLPNAPMAIGKSLGQWFGYSLIVGAVAGYARHHTRSGRRLSARGKSPAAFDWRCIPPCGVAPRSQMPQFAPSSRLAMRAHHQSRCNAGFHHGLLWHRLPRHRDGRVRRLLAGDHAEQHLVVAELALYAGNDVRRAGLCAVDRRHVRLALAVAVPQHARGRDENAAYSEQPW